MTIGASEDRDTTLACFQDLKKLANSLGLSECSMGMSNDYLEAIKFGATSVRVGSLFFGERNY